MRAPCGRSWTAIACPGTPHQLRQQIACVLIAAVDRLRAEVIAGDAQTLTIPLSDLSSCYCRSKGFVAGPAR